MEQVEPTRSLFLLLSLSLSLASFRAPAATLPLPCSLARGATSCIHSARLSPPRGVAWAAQELLVLYVARLIPRPRASEYPRKYRTHVLWSLWLLARNDGHDHGCP